MDRERKVNANCANAGNPFHQCSDHCGQRSSQPHPKPRIVGGGRTPGPDRDGVRVAGRSADPNCVNASNPFHQCAEYCVKRTSDSKKPGSGRFAIPVRGKPSPKSHSDRRDGARSVLGGGSVGIEGRSVDPNCANAGNPFHQCGDHCANKSKDARKQIGTAKTLIVNLDHSIYVHDIKRKFGRRKKGGKWLQCVWMHPIPSTNPQRTVPKEPQLQQDALMDTLQFKMENCAKRKFGRRKKEGKWIQCVWMHPIPYTNAPRNVPKEPQLQQDDLMDTLRKLCQNRRKLCLKNADPP